MAMLDPWKADAFTMVSLTQALEKLEYRPGRIGELGIFRVQGVPTTTIVVEERDGLLALLPTKARGGPATVGKGEKRKVRSFALLHIPYEDLILADDVQNVRAFGSDNALDGVAAVVTQRLSRMREDVGVTIEHLCMGALQGNILDADGTTVLYNLFNEFGVAEQSVDFKFSVSATDIRTVCLAAKRKVEDALGAAAYTGIRVFCGSAWFDALIKHADVKAAYTEYQASEWLRNDPRAGFLYGGLTFEEYRGTVSGVAFLAADEARAVPEGVANLCSLYYGPADFNETVNTIGLPMYAKQVPMDLDRGTRLHVQTNPLPLCHMPRTLVKFTES